MERAPLLRLKREIEASGDEEAVEPEEGHLDLNGDQHDPEAGGNGEDHHQVEPDGDDKAADGGDDDKADADEGDDDKADANGGGDVKADADEGDDEETDADGGDDDKADADGGDDDKADADGGDGDPDGGHLDISETEEAEASGDDHVIDYLRE
jgi:hypothetical protein